MEIIRKDGGYQHRFADVPIGGCFVLPNGETAYIKVCGSLGVCVINLANGNVWAFTNDKAVVPVKATLIVTDYDC